MRKRIWIITSATALVVAITTTLAATSRRPGSQDIQAAADSIPSKSGQPASDVDTPRYFGITPETRAEARRAMEGCVIATNPAFLCKDIDQATAEELAVLFRAQGPVPPDRLEHFAWLDQAKDDFPFVGWRIAIDKAVHQGDGWLLDLSVKPAIESETAIGGLVYDQYLETYIVRDGWFEYLGGRSPDIVRHMIQPDPGLPDTYSYD